MPRLHEVTFTNGISPVDEHNRETIFFASHGEARKWCNEKIRAALARWKEFDGVERLSDVGWGEEISIRAVETVPATKALLVRLLNYEGGYVTSERVVEQWNPQDKWHTPPGGEE